jgi:hypothetical protein
MTTPPISRKKLCKFAALFAYLVAERISHHNRRQSEEVKLIKLSMIKNIEQ